MKHVEYVDWLTYFRIKDRRVGKIEMYLARLSCMYAQANGVKNAKVTEYVIAEEAPKTEADKDKELVSKLKLWAAQNNHLE